MEGLHWRQFTSTSRVPPAHPIKVVQLTRLVNVILRPRSFEGRTALLVVASGEPQTDSFLSKERFSESNLPVWALKTPNVSPAVCVCYHGDDFA